MGGTITKKWVEILIRCLIVLRRVSRTKNSLRDSLSAAKGGARETIGGSPVFVTAIISMQGGSLQNIIK